MEKEKLIENFKLSLEQKYNAVCFDIDGTLTIKNSKKIDERAIQMIADLLKRKIPIVFITGRGETGLDDLKKDIYYTLRSKYSINNREFRKIYVLTNDGARLFYTVNGDNDILKNNIYISTNQELNELKIFDNNIIQFLKINSLQKVCEITYSFDKTKKIILNVRLVLKSKDERIFELLFNGVNAIIRRNNLNNICISRGIYKDKTVIQIGTARKEFAIEKAEEIIGIPKSSMIRIGDCGDLQGNDYSMLNCSQGYSVDKTSGKIDSCFPIIDDEGKILKGIDATLYLIKKAKILPTICLEHAMETNYVKEYAKVEKCMNLGKNQRISNYNNIVNKKFGSVDGIYGLYDKCSGSVKIPMYEWNCIEDYNPLKLFWNTTESYMNYAMFDNDSILLRGSKVYYYFLANRFHDEMTNKDITSKSMVNEWLNNNLKFFNDALIALKNMEKIEDANDSKMVLGMIDNIRNELLILLNQQLVRNVEKNLLINLNSETLSKILYKIYYCLIEVNQLMKKISFDIDYKINVKEINFLLQKAILITRDFQIHFNKESEKENYSKEFRVYREIDNFAENFITCDLIIKKDLNIFNKGICGVCYGGLELPIIIKSIDDRISDVSILKFNKNVTGYTKKQSLELRFFDIFKAGGIELLEINKQKNYILLDDNLLTGKTMQLAISTFYDIGINVEKIAVVRYPGVNRVSQMFLPNHGAIDYRCFFDFIEGLYFLSPYSWRDSYSADIYEDSLGIFDLNRRKILECLVKNGDFSKNSEVLYIKKKVKHEN